MKFVDIILPLPLPNLYTYSIPESLENTTLVGKRVIVQFGRKKFYTAIVRKEHNKKPSYATKSISSVLDEQAIISETQFKFWEWIASYYMANIGEVYKAALPSGLKLESETIISFVKGKVFENISEKQEEILNLLENEKTISIKKLQNNFDFDILISVKKLIDKKYISVEEKIRNKYKAKTESYIRLAKELKDTKKFAEVLLELRRAKKQSELLLNFTYISKYGSDLLDGIQPSEEIKRTDLLKHTESSSAILKQLIEKGYLIEEKKEIGRLLQDFDDDNIVKTLNEYQEKALAEIRDKFKEKDTVLLHGVTSSGKTEIYIKLIQEQLDKGKQVLYLLPEIALTAQIINRLTNIFGNLAGVYHSKFNDAERVEIWNSLQENGINKTHKIILGVRSSVFLPFTNLGLIIVDEEHENTYKQYNPAPRYNARDASIVLAKLHKAKVLLGTATPSIESYYNAKTDKYGLVEILNRYKDIQLPEILIADTKEARRKKQMKSLFTPLLLDNIKEALANNEQVILFQNRRGFSPFMECETCGWIPKCEHCDVSLTYHKYTTQLVCHYCGFSYKSSKKCKACGDIAMTTRGFGTEQIEDELLELIPEAKVIRMDVDSTRSKKAYSKIISDFESGRANVLVGTQMVSKGLDFDNVSIVGIMNADNLLNFPDFRAFERSFQLMAQVSGRAGRKNKQGKVIIQTSDRKHEVIKNVLSNDFVGLFNAQLIERKMFKYPPYYRLIQISIKHKKNYIVDNASAEVAKRLRLVFGDRILGPEYPVISRIKNWYIKNILIKIEKKASVQKAKQLIISQIEVVKENDKYKYVQFVFDVDVF